MNQKQHALSTHLELQRHENVKQLLIIEQQILNLEHILQESKQKMITSCIMPAFILPEQEMARSLFIQREHRIQEDCRVQIRPLIAERENLKTQQIHLNTQLKLLKKHQARQHQNDQYQAQLTQQKQIDEWVLQRREHS